MARFSNASQRARPHLHAASSAVVALTLMFTFFTVRHLAGAIAVRRSLANSGELEVRGHKLLSDTTYVVEEGRPHWLSDGSIRKTADSIRVSLQESTTKRSQLPTGRSRRSGNVSTIQQQRQRVGLGQCELMAHTDYWGEPVKWGPDNKLPSAESCCAACHEHQASTPEDLECNVWVYCGDAEKCGADYTNCWLKHLAHPDAVAPKTGADIPWTSGILQAPALDSTDTAELQEGRADRRYHIVITAQGAATHWQARVHYYWYKKVKAKCEAAGQCDMGGFTRLLHSGVPDDLMDEMPTFVANPLPDEGNKGYVVLNRPSAFVQWLQGTTIKEKYVFMSEPDHIWLKPMPNLMLGHRPAAFPFFYIEPSKTDFLPITQKFTGPLTRKQAEQIAPIGNAPTLLSLKQLQQTAPTWMNTSMNIFNDVEANKAWGWVLEMYGFAISCFIEGVGPIDLHLNMISQPPWDEKLDPYYILHYTYGNDYTLEGVFTPGKYGAWRFDKRTYAAKPPPRNLGAPPAGMQNELVRHLINALNEATDHIPGWDEYSATGQASQLWDGNL